MSERSDAITRTLFYQYSTGKKTVLFSFAFYYSNRMPQAHYIRIVLPKCCHCLYILHIGCPKEARTEASAATVVGDGVDSFSLCPI